MAYLKLVKKIKGNKRESHNQLLYKYLHTLHFMTDFIIYDRLVKQ